MRLASQQHVTNNLNQKKWVIPELVMLSVYVRNGPGMSQVGKQSPLTNVAGVVDRPGLVTGSSLLSELARRVIWFD